MKRVKLLVFMFLIALFVLVACSEDSTGPGNDNQLNPNNAVDIFFNSLNLSIFNCIAVEI